MKEYIFARPNVVTLKEAMHDAYFRGEVIRCKDCKYAYKTFNSYTCQRVFHPFTIEDDGFCSWAERKEE